MAAHAKLAPSAAHRWIRCPGSVAIAAKYPYGSSIHADEGTFAHSVAASCLEKEVDAKVWLGKKSDCGRFTVNDEMVGAIQEYLDAVRGTLLMEGGGLIVEKKVKLAGVLAPLVSGTPDAVIVVGRRVHVFDFKYGAGVFVPAEDNEQLMTYAAGAMVSHGPGDEVVMHIVQPRCTHQGKAWRTVTMPAAELMKWADETLLVAAKATQADDPPLVPGEKQCQWCPAKVDCPARKAEALAVAQHVFAPGSNKPVAPPPAETLDPDEIGKLLTMFPRVESWMKAVREHAFEQSKKGQPPPGFKLVEKIGLRKWIDEEQAKLALRSAGIDPMATAKLRSPAQAEKALGKAKASLVARLAHKPATGAVLVPDSDKRPALNPASAFDSLTQ